MIRFSRINLLTVDLFVIGLIALVSLMIYCLSLDFADVSKEPYVLELMKDERVLKYAEENELFEDGYISRFEYQRCKTYQLNLDRATELKKQYRELNR